MSSPISAKEGERGCIFADVEGGVSRDRDHLGVQRRLRSFKAGNILDLIEQVLFKVEELVERGDKGKKYKLGIKTLDFNGELRGNPAR